MAIFNSYVKLPEGIYWWQNDIYIHLWHLTWVKHCHTIDTKVKFSPVHSPSLPHQSLQMSSWLRQCFSSVNINHLELQSSCNRTTQLWLWLLWLAAHESNMNLNNESFQSESDAGFSNPNEASCEKQWQLEKHTYLVQNVHYFKENSCFLFEWQGTSCASCVHFFSRCALDDLYDFHATLRQEHLCPVCNIPWLSYFVGNEGTIATWHHRSPISLEWIQAKSNSLGTPVSGENPLTLFTIPYQ